MFMVRENNLRLIRKYFLEHEEATKLDISQGTGLSIATSGNMLNDMLKTGEIVEAGQENPNGGRPATRYAYDPNHTLFAAIRVEVENGDRSLEGFVINGFGEIINKEQGSYQAIDKNTILSMAAGMLAKFEQIRLLMIGVPGIVKDDVIDYCDEENLNGEDLASLIEEELGIQVCVENFSRIKLYGYYCAHPKMEKESLALLSMPKGHCLQLGLICDGHMMYGCNGIAGESQYLPYYYGATQTLVKEVVSVISSVIAIVNPMRIVITGKELSSENRREVIQELEARIPKQYIPDIEYIEEEEEIYLDGLIHYLRNEWYGL